MNDIVQKVTTDLSFHEGRLVPVGTIITVDTSKGNFDFSDPKLDGSGGNTPNLADVGNAVVNVATPVAPIGPTGPFPTMPQQVPPGAFQTSAGYVVPGGALLVAEGSVAAAEAAAQGTVAEQNGIEEEGPVRRQAAELTGDATTAALNPSPTKLDGLNADERAELEELRRDAATRLTEGAAAPTPPTSADPNAFNPETVIDGTVPDVTGRLDGLTREQLVAVKDAEADREQPRVGVTNAIDAAIAKLDAPADEA